MEDVRPYLEILIETLEKKEKLLNSILENSKQQGILAKQEKFEIDKFTDLVKIQQNLIDNVNKLDDGFESVYSRIKETVKQNKELYKTQILKIQSLIKIVTALGVDISALEQQNKQYIENQFNNTKQYIKRFRQNNRAVTDYYKTMSKTQVIDSIFLDRKK